jgi:hypothetical protein
VKRLSGTLGAIYPKVSNIPGIGRMRFQDPLKRLDVAGNLSKKLGLDRKAAGLSTAFSERFRPQLKAMPHVQGIAGLNHDALRGFRGIAGVDHDELKRISGLAGFKAIDPKLFETAGWLRKLPDPTPWLRQFQGQIGTDAGGAQGRLAGELART